MKQFTLKDCQPWAGHLGLFADRSELVQKLTPWQEMGLQQTASGYGRKLNSGLMIHFEGKLRRIYTTCFSNVGSSWFTFKGQTVFVN